LTGLRGVERVAPVVTFAAAAVFVGKLAFASAPLYRSVLTEPILLSIASLTKLFLLFLGFYYSARNASGFDADNPIRPAWRLLAAGLGSFFLGQLCPAPYQLALHVPSPFPSVADVFFVACYPLFVGAFAGFVRAYQSAGVPIGSRGQRWALGLAVAAAGALVAYVVLKPVVAAPAPFLAELLNVAYPTLDLVLLVPIVLLIRITAPMRGGEVWRMWVALLGGFLFMCGGDVLFAYLSGLGVSWVDPLVDALFILSYGFIARGVVVQQRLLGA
jgi:hypothetical protein